MATKNICIGFNRAYAIRYFADCEVLNKRLEVGDTYKDEEVLEVSDFEEQVATKTPHIMQMVTTVSYHEVVIIEED